MASRMKYAFSSTQRIPEWNSCYYDYHNLSKIVEVLQISSYYYKQFRHRYLAPSQRRHFQNHQRYAREMMKLIEIMDISNKFFFDYRSYEMKVIQLFVQYKIIELKMKESKYREMCGVLVPRLGIRDELITLDCLILFENLYIQYVYLIRMLNFNLKKQGKILNLHKLLVQKFGQLDTPNVDFRKIKRYQTMLYTYKIDVENYIRQHKLYSSLEQANYTIGSFNNFSPKKNEENQLTIMFGFWCGIIASLIGVIVGIVLIYNIQIGKQDQLSQFFATSFPVWRGLSYLCLYLWILGIGLKVLEIYSINYTLLFAMDYNYVPNSNRVLIISATLSTVYLVTFAFYLFYLKQDLQNPHVYNLGGYIWLMIIAIFMLPLPILHFKSRWYMIKMFFQMFFTPIIGVQFKFHWLTQNFVSMKQSYHDIFYTISYFTIGQPKNISLIGGTTVGLYFFALRISQSFRQAYQNGAFFGTPLMNAVTKSSLGFITIVISFLYRMYSGTAMLALWILTATVATLFTYHFDVRYDWGLLQPRSSYKQYFLLRKNLTFSPYVYYFIMALNLILRMAWVLTISSGFIESLPIPSYIFLMIVTFLEIIRRGIWNILRIQNQHINKCQRFSAIIEYQNVQRKVYQRYRQAKQNRDLPYIELQLTRLQKHVIQMQLQQVRQSIEKTQKNQEQIQIYLTKATQILQKIQSYACQQGIQPLS